MSSKTNNIITNQEQSSSNKSLISLLRDPSNIISSTNNISDYNPSGTNNNLNSDTNIINTVLSGNSSGGISNNINNNNNVGLVSSRDSVVAAISAREARSSQRRLQATNEIHEFLKFSQLKVNFNRYYSYDQEI